MKFPRKTIIGIIVSQAQIQNLITETRNVYYRDNFGY